MVKVKKIIIIIIKIIYVYIYIYIFEDKAKDNYLKKIVNTRVFKILKDIS